MVASDAWKMAPSNDPLCPILCVKQQIRAGCQERKPCLFVTSFLMAKFKGINLQEGYNYDRVKGWVKTFG